MHPFLRVMPSGLEPLDLSLHSPFKLSHLISQPQLFPSLPNSHDCWCWAMGLHPPMWLSPTLPLLPTLRQSTQILVSQPQSHVPLACGPVHCPCALPGCAACVRCLGAACARGLGALPMRAASARPVRTAWALGPHAVCTACVHGLHAVRAAWACGLPAVRAATFYCEVPTPGPTHRWSPSSPPGSLDGSPHSLGYPPAHRVSFASVGIRTRHQELKVLREASLLPTELEASLLPTKLLAKLVAGMLP